MKETKSRRVLWARLNRTARRALCAALAAAALALPSQAGRAVNVQVDGGLLTARSYVKQGVTYVPLRTLLDAFGGWEVWWNHNSGTAEASGSARLTADPAAGTVTVNGTHHTGRVTVENGRTYVPLRLVAEALGGRAEWDGYLDGAAVTSPGAEYDAADLYWLARIICAESGAEPMEGQIAVGNVVLNRVASREFPDTIPGVIFDRVDAVQFEPVENGTVYDSPAESSVEAAMRVLDGEEAVEDVMYFYAPALSRGVWINANRTYSTTIGCHRFYF